MKKRKGERGEEGRDRSRVLALEKKICEIKSEKLIYKSEEVVDNDGRQLQSV